MAMLGGCGGPSSGEHKCLTGEVRLKVEHTLYTYFLECSAEGKLIPPPDTVQARALHSALRRTGMSMDTFKALFYCLLDNPQEFEGVMRAVVEKLKRTANEQNANGSGRPPR